MKFAELLQLVGREPMFHSSLLQAGNVNNAQLRLQLARWKKAGKLIQLRRGVYIFGSPYRKVEPHPFVLANALRRNSYVSVQSALAYHGLIPEHVPVVTSVTTARPERLNTPVGKFIFHHLQPPLLFGYREIEVSRKQATMVATAEKALLDLVYLTPGADQLSYLRQLRLQNTEFLDQQVLSNFASRFCKPKMLHARDNILQVLREERSESYEELSTSIG